MAGDGLERDELEEEEARARPWGWGWRWACASQNGVRTLHAMGYIDLLGSNPGNRTGAWEWRGPATH